MLVLLGLLIQVVLGQEGASVSGGTRQSDYQCSDSCKPPSCFCPSPKPPGGLAATSIPQFITLTFDDSINSVVLSQILNFTSNYTNPNGCSLSATFFVSTQYSDFWDVQRMYSLGHEIAVHTINHVANPSLAEIVGSVKATSAFGGVPVNKIAGFRTPFLSYSTATFQHLQKAGSFMYDSSMPVSYLSSPTFPYTLDYGPYSTCSPGTCEKPFSFPGLFEIPLYSLVNDDGTENATMDLNPPAGTTRQISADDVVGILKSNFNRRYTSSRLPLGIYLHAASSVRTDAYIEGVRRFMDWIKTNNYTDVYWVSNQQLIAWMKAPSDIKASLSSPALDCLMPAVDPSNPEICDGIDNNGNGGIDEGLTTSCYFPATQSSFTSCFECPTMFPTVSNPTPFATGMTRKTVPATGCPNQGTWDPVTGNCVALKRAKKVSQVTSTNCGANSNGDCKHDSGSTYSSLSSRLSWLLTVFLVISTII